MPPFRYTLRHNASTFDWELADAGGVASTSHHTRSSAFARLAADPQVLVRGATVRVFSADGGYERDRTYRPAPALEPDTGVQMPIALGAR